MIALRITLAVCSVALVAACSAQPTSTQISLRNVYQSLYCGTDEPGLRWLTSEEFATLMRGPGAGQHLGAEPVPAPQIAADERLLQVSLGQKGSGGHAVALNSDSAQVQQDVVLVPLAIAQPSAGSMQTMQITYPCLVLALPQSGYSRVSGGDLGEVDAGK